MGNPTVQTLESLAAALHISPRMLLVEFGSSVRVIRGADMVRTAAGPAARVNLDAVYGSGWAQTQLIELTAAAGPVHHEPEASGSLNQVWVVEGRLRLGPDNEVEELAEGDFIRFPADVHHGYEPLTERVRLHVTTTIPQVSQLERVAER